MRVVIGTVRERFAALFTLRGYGAGVGTLVFGETGGTCERLATNFTAVWPESGMHCLNVA